MPTLAIIGTGIAGMSCGYYLHKQYDITVFEQASYAGGHTNTISVNENGTPVYFDTGFMVFNHITYPLLTKLFDELGVDTKPTSMSFSVQHLQSGLEYCGSGLIGLFAQRKNVFNVRFIKMLLQISRFNSESVKLLASGSVENLSVKDFCHSLGLGNDFLEKYLIPMSGAVWSTPPDKMLGFPAQTLVRFFHNHGFLGLHTQHQWYTVNGGSRMYRDKIIAPYKDRLRLNDAAVAVTRLPNGKAEVRTQHGHTQEFDKVILACHADQALRILQQPTTAEQRLLSCFRYQPNRAIVHTDETVMPRTRRAWSSWNYRIGSNLVPSTIYWMNSLQGVSDKRNYFVSINGADAIDPKKVITEIDYEHPLFDVASQQAQTELQTLNGKDNVYFCGSYFRYGFHEDALLSATELCKLLLNQPKPSF
ncbi:MAG: FAD-dependent oxidoreductase [Bacteroidia bacterium]|nr:FAD-dependent oxidoreductase [Bacteroidia bacterium]